MVPLAEGGGGAGAAIDAGPVIFVMTETDSPPTTTSNTRSRKARRERWDNEEVMCSPYRNRMGRTRSNPGAGTHGCQDAAQGGLQLLARGAGDAYADSGHRRRL